MKLRDQEALTTGEREVMLPLFYELKNVSYTNYVCFNIDSGNKVDTLLFPVSSTVKSLTCYADYPGPYDKICGY